MHRGARLVSAAFVALCCGAPREAASLQIPPPELPRYRLRVKVLPDAPRLEVAGSLRLPPESTPRSSLELMLSSTMRDLKVEVVEPVASAGPASVERKTQDATVTWSVRPPSPIPAGAGVLLRFSCAGGERSAYQFDLSRQSSIALGLNTPWYPWFEHRRGTGLLELSVPERYAAVAAGELCSTATEKAHGLFRYEARQPLFFSFAIGRYTSSSRPGPVRIAAHLLRPRPAIREYLEGCAKSLRVLEREFGPYPYGGLSLVEVPADQANERASLFAGTSVAGIIFIRSEMLDRRFNLAYFAHEIGHQWWGNLVLPEGTRGSMMLTEGMAQYGALQVVRAVEGEASAERFRRTGYPGFLFQSGEGALLYSASGLDQPLSHLGNGYVAHELANSKGFFVLDMLSAAAGRENLRTALQEISRRAATRGVSWVQFLQTIERYGHQDLRWFYVQWFDRTGAPEWTTRWTQRRERLRVRIRQQAPFYHAAVDVLIVGTGGRRQTRQLRLQGPESEAEWSVPFPARSVVVDPHFRVLHWTPEYRDATKALAPVWHADAARQEGRTEAAIREYEAALTVRPGPDPHAARFLAEMGLGFALTDQKKWGEARTHLEAALKCPTRQPEMLPWVYYVLATIAKEGGSRRPGVGGGSGAHGRCGASGANRGGRSRRSARGTAVTARPGRTARKTGVQETALPAGL